jgi:hypothetical protein
MNKLGKMWVALAGGLIVAAIVGTAVVMAQTSDTPTTTPDATATPGSGSFKSNEDATHESSESTARETAEDSGQGFHHGNGKGGSNEDPTHEANEPAGRESNENSGLAPGAGPTAGPTSGA